jgi:uncharacterized protein YdiU (UPF0061 family)
MTPAMSARYLFRRHDRQREINHYHFVHLDTQKRYSYTHLLAMSSGHTLQQVLEALQQLYQNPDPNVKKGANEWLQEFQHSVS